MYQFVDEGLKLLAKLCVCVLHVLMFLSFLVVLVISSKIRNQSQTQEISKHCLSHAAEVRRGRDDRHCNGSNTCRQCGS